MAGKTKFQAKDGWIANWKPLYAHYWTFWKIDFPGFGNGARKTKMSSSVPCTAQQSVWCMGMGPWWQRLSRAAEKPKPGPAIHTNHEAFGFGRLQPTRNFCPSKSCSNFLKNFNYQEWPDKFCFLSFARHRVLPFIPATVWRAWRRSNAPPPFEGYVLTEAPVGRPQRWPAHDQAV